MPRVYFFRLLEKFLGVTELEFLRRCEQTSPWLMRRFCGFPWPDTLPDTPLLYQFDEVAQEHSLKIVQVASFNAIETVERLRSESPDVIIGLGTRILKAHVLESARIGTLNAHSSLLPNYRGGSTEFWQLVEGETQTGVTIHWMAPKVDSGNIFLQKRWPIPNKTSHYQLRVQSLFYRLELWREVIETLTAGEILRQPQEISNTPTFRSPTFDQEYDFYCRGIRNL